MINSLAIYEDFAKTKDIANALANSDLIPPHFQRKPANVLIALEFAHRNNIAPFAAMQSLFVVKGKVGMAATMAIALARKWDVFKELYYEVTGEGESLKVEAIAETHSGKLLHSEASMKMAITAGWVSNPLYKSIPEQMLKYRAATFLIRSHFPEVLFGMQTKEELDDVESANEAAKKAVNVTPKEEIKPATVIEAVIESKPEAQTETLERDIEDLRGELLDFLKSRSNAWFEVLGKNKLVMVEMTENEQDLERMKQIMAKTLQYDKLATIALEKAKNDLISEQKEVMSEALS